MIRIPFYRRTWRPCCAKRALSGWPLCPLPIAHPPDVHVPPALPVIRPLVEQVAALEREAIAAAMAASRGNKVVAARMQGISRAKL